MSLVSLSLAITRCSRKVHSDRIRTIAILENGLLVCQNSGMRSATIPSNGPLMHYNSSAHSKCDGNNKKSDGNQKKKN